MTPRVAVVGGGLAGLTAAHRLLARGIEVTLIDMGQRAGGRLCTRSVVLSDGRTARFDLGPPLIYQRLYPGIARTGLPSYRTSNLAAEIPGDGLFQQLQVGRIGAAGEGAGYAPITGLAAIGGMRELAFRLVTAHGDRLDFRDYTRAVSLEHTETGWRISTQSLRGDYATTITANGLLLTPPVPQTLALIESNQIPLPDDVRDALRGVTYTRCIAVYGAFTGVETLPPGGIWFGDGPVEWIADNHRKNVSSIANSISALTSDEWAREHWKEPEARVLELLLPLLRRWVGEPIGATDVHVHRWKWAKPLTPIRSPCSVLRDLCLVLAGDGFAGSSPDPADAAVASGEAAAQRMGGLLTEVVRANNRYTVPRPRRYKLEIAVSSPDEARTAAINGADRLELASALEVGGLTPSLGLFREVRDLVEVPVYVLLRPRVGGFVYTDREFAAMQADAEMFLAEDANGIVFGILTGAGNIDHARCRALVELAKGKAVFHRAFDFLPDRIVALDELIDLGFERVLTSGGARTAEAGTNALAALVQHAGWQIEVLPAGSIRPHNVADLVRATRCDQVHAAVRVPLDNPVIASHPWFATAMGAASDMSGQLVEGLRAQLDLPAELL